MIKYLNATVYKIYSMGGNTFLFLVGIAAILLDYFCIINLYFIQYLAFYENVLAMSI